MRREELYLCDIVEAALAIEGFIAGVDEQAFHASDLIRSAVLQKLTVIGEAAARLSGEFRGHHPSVEWAEIIGFRNIAVHAYFSIDWRIVWTAAMKEVPQIRRKVVELQEREFSAPDSQAQGPAR